MKAEIANVVVKWLSTIIHFYNGLCRSFWKVVKWDDLEIVILRVQSVLSLIPVALASVKKLLDQNP